MNEKEARELAVEFAKMYRPTYYTEPFTPHEWVVQAIMESFRKGHRIGYDDRASAGGW